MSRDGMDQAIDGLMDDLHRRDTPEPRQAQPADHEAGHDPEQYAHEGYQPNEYGHEAEDSPGMTVDEASDTISALGEVWNTLSDDERSEASEFVEAVVGDLPGQLAAEGYSVDAFADALEQTGDLSAALAVVEAIGPEATSIADATEQALEWQRQDREAGRA
jgi:hypothetical protein